MIQFQPESRWRCYEREACRNGGFTLIELLVVVAAIAILASLLLPAFAKAKSNVLQEEWNPWPAPNIIVAEGDQSSGETITACSLPPTLRSRLRKGAIKYSYCGEKALLTDFIAGGVAEVCDRCQQNDDDVSSDAWQSVENELLILVFISPIVCPEPAVRVMIGAEITRRKESGIGGHRAITP